MTRFLAVLSLIFSTLSVALLMKGGLDHGFVTPLGWILETYNQLMGELFVPAKTLIEAATREAFGYDLRLESHWKHIFLLIGIYVFQDAYTFFKTGNRGSGYAHLIWGSALAFLCAVGVGAMPLTPNDPSERFLVAALPILCIGLYEIGSDIWMVSFWPRRPGRTFLAALTGRFAEDLLIVAVGVGFVALWVSSAYVPANMNSGLVALAIVVAGFSILELAIAARRVMKADVADRWTTFWQQGNTKVGMARLSAFIAVGVFVLFNAGLRSAGVQ